MPRRSVTQALKVTGRERLVDPGPPVRVSYQLTKAGRALEQVIASIDTWAATWLVAIDKHPQPMHPLS